MLFVFLTLGFALEALHGFKVGLYLDVNNHTRRHMWTLAHAHGTLLGLVHLAYAGAIAAGGEERLKALRGASGLLLAAGLLLPLGFFLGGVWFFAGDPGPGIALVPVGGVCLLWGVFVVARRV